MDYENTTLVSSDWIPRFQSGDFDTLIESLAPMGYSGSELLTKLNEANYISYCGIQMLAQYLADRQMAGALTGISLQDGPDVTGTERYVAPTGIGNSESGVWFTTPNTSTEYVRWYVNGELKIERQQDLSSNRSATLSELGASIGDVVQVCIVAGGVVGWWGRSQLV